MTKRHAPPPRRSAKSQRPRRVIRLLTEGRRTEVEYFAKWAAEFRDRVTIDFDHFHGTPLSLVERAADLVDQRRRSLRRRTSDVAFDEIWCVFDRDEHPFVGEAIALAERNEIGVAFSNPCFELWLVLHAQDLRRHTERGIVQDLSASHGFTTGKALAVESWDRLRSTWEPAEKRGEALDVMHNNNGSPSRSNPSTTVGHLVRWLHETR